MGKYLGSLFTDEEEATEKHKKCPENLKDISNTCEWCGITYSQIDKTVTYLSVIVFKKEHKICNECYERLEKVPDKE